MPLYKIWTWDRKSRKMVVADSYKDIVMKAAAKLGVDSENCRLLLECDGTEVDEEVVSELGGQTLMLLKAGEQWQPEGAAAPSCALDTSVANISAVNIATNAVLPIQSSVSLPSAAASTSVPHVLVLPDFSAYVKTALRNGDSGSVWQKMIEEMAHFYLDVIADDLTSQTQYLDIGRRMVEVYPCVNRVGAKPWSVLTKALSQRIRTERFNRKRKSLSSASSTTDQSSATKVARTQELASISLEDISSQLLSEEDYKSHIDELKRAAGERVPNMTHVRQLLKQSYNNRREWFRQLETLDVQKILEVFPCLQQGKYVFEELKLVLGLNDDGLEQLGKRMEGILQKVAQVEKTDTLDVGNVITLFKAIEVHTAFRKGKGEKTKSIIRSHDCIISEFQKFLETPRNDGPQLVVFTSHGQFEMATVVLDGTHIECQACDVVQAFLILLACYFVFDIAYPRSYSQILGFFEQYVFNQVFTGKKSSNFANYVAKLGL